MYYRHSPHLCRSERVSGLLSIHHRPFRVGRGGMDGATLLYYDENQLERQAGENKLYKKIKYEKSIFNTFPRCGVTGIL